MASPYSPTTGTTNQKYQIVWHAPEQFGEHRCNSCGKEIPLATALHAISVSVGPLFNGVSTLRLRVCVGCYAALFPWTP